MKLTLAEGLFLIALDDNEGKLIASAAKTIDRGLIATSIIDLYLHDKLEIDEHLNVSSANNGFAGNKLLDDILKLVSQGQKPLLEMVEFVFENYKDIQVDINNLLIDRGVIKREATKLFWIPVSERMENANYSYEQEIRDALHKIVVKNVKGPASLISLFVLISYCNLVTEVFSNKDEQISARKFLNAIFDKDWLNNTTISILKALKPYFEKLG
jgi:hypothetical protein